MSTVYILIDHNDGHVDSAAAELFTLAQGLGEATAVVVGEPGTAAALQPELQALGAARIVAAEAEGASRRLILPAVDALSSLAAGEAGPILISATAAGNEIAGRVAARVASGVLVDITGINPDRSATMSIFGDTIAVDTAVGGESPVYTVRRGAIEVSAATPGAGELLAIELPAPDQKNVEITSFSPAERGNRPDLAEAKTVIAGGRGVGSAEGFAELVEGLADSMGAAVGATRDAVDLGYCPSALQIGQTGVTISPDLYIGLGISGAIQHTSGMQTSRTIIAVTNDEDAPIMSIADLGVVADVHDLAPELAREIRERKA